MSRPPVCPVQNMLWSTNIPAPVGERAGAVVVVAAAVEAPAAARPDRRAAASSLKMHICSAITEVRRVSSRQLTVATGQ